jgi:hypothetical protein
MTAAVNVHVGSAQSNRTWSLAESYVTATEASVTPPVAYPLPLATSPVVRSSRKSSASRSGAFELVTSISLNVSVSRSIATRLPGSCSSRWLAGVSTRRFERTREPVAAEVEQGARSTSKSAVSREFVARTREQLDALMSRRLDDVRLAVLMVDGIDLKGAARTWRRSGSPPTG